MAINSFIEKLRKNPRSITLAETVNIIDANYNHTPTAFENGDQRNEIGQNTGSCKIFFFAKLHNLNEEETLACFGDFYFDDVLGNPEGKSHLNIRNFIKYGWAGVRFEGDALTLR